MDRLVVVVARVQTSINGTGRQIGQKVAAAGDRHRVVEREGARRVVDLDLLSAWPAGDEQQVAVRCQGDDHPAVGNHVHDCRRRRRRYYGNTTTVSDQ